MIYNRLYLLLEGSSGLSKLKKKSKLSSFDNYKYGVKKEKSRGKYEDNYLNINSKLIKKGLLHKRNYLNKEYHTTKTGV